MTRHRSGEPDLPPGPGRELVDLFRRLRRGRPLSGGQLAVAAGLSAGHVSQVLRGVKAPSPQAAAKIAQCLGATGEQARKAYQLAEQLRELNRYYRTRDTKPPVTSPGAQPDSPLRPQADDRGGPLAPPASPERVRPVVEVFPVAIGHYADPGFPDLDVQAPSGRLVDLLAPFGGLHRPWRHPAHGRGADAVQHRLREWSRPPASPGGSAGPGEAAGNPTAGSSVLYWAGHGWSDGARAALAHAESPVAVGESGLEPHQLAQAIRARQAGAGAGAHPGAGGWALVVLEGDHATQVADAVMAALHGPDAPDRLLLVAVPRDGAGPAGGFAGLLAALLAGTYLAEHRIALRDLAAQLERLLGPRNVHQRGLGEAALVRVHPPVASWMSAPVDTIRHLEEVLAELPADERNHFLVKAQGAEHGELSWFFEGRENELAQIAAWLGQAGSGLLVVTGRAGSGKSALLGTALVRSVPALRDALARRDLVPAPGPGAGAPPESVFDAVIHLRGLDLGQATERIATAAGAGPLPSRRDRAAGVASDLDFLAGALDGRAQPFTVLADALDESVDPLDIARALLARIATLPRVRVVVGTRASTLEAPDSPADDENLLGALGVSAAGARTQAAGRGADDAGRVIWVGRDQQAISRYVTGRLRAARDHGLTGRAVAHMAEVSDRDIARAAQEVAGRGGEFLFARLAVYELIADPRLLTSGMAHSRGRLLQGTHQDLFGRAVHRLASHDDRYPALLRALSLARGRGVPEADGIWAAIAAALAPAAPPAGGHPGQDLVPGAAAAWVQAIGALLDQAAAYITADTSPGRGPAPGRQTVYRLAHQTFVDYFATHPPPGQDGGDARELAAGALLHAAAQAASTAGPGQLPTYLVRHLSGHAAEAGRWEELARLPLVLDRIDPSAVTADAIRTLFGRAVPPLIAGIIGARDILAAAGPADRPGLRQLATTIHSSRRVVGEPAAGWGVAAAQAGHATVHVTLSGHSSAVNRVRSLNLPDGRMVVASCSDDGTIRLWDPATATPVGVPMEGHDGTVEDICVLPVPHGGAMLASTGGDGTVRLWEPAAGRPARGPLTSHDGPLWVMCVVPGRPGQPPLLATAGVDGTVRLWDAATGQPTIAPLTGHIGPVWAVCALPGRAGQPPILASAGVDGTVRLWNPVTGQPTGQPLTGHTAPIRCVCVVPGRPGQPPVLASAADDGTVRLWDVATGQPTIPPLTGHVGPVWDVCVVPGRPGEPPVLASTGEDGTVRLWDAATGQPAGQPLTGHTGPVRGVCSVPGRPGQPPVLASAGEDSTVRLWGPVSGQPAGPPQTGYTGPVWGVCVMPRRAGEPPALASAGEDGTVRLWDAATGAPIGQPLTGHTGPVRGVCAAPRRAGEPPILASAGEDGTVRLWDAATGAPIGQPLTGHTGPVRNVCAVPGQPPILASTGRDGTVRLWDLTAGRPTGPPLTGHSGPVRGVCVVPGRPGEPPVLASAGVDGTVRRWDLAAGQPAGPPLTRHSGPVVDVCVVPGRPGEPPVLASAGMDGTALWDLVTGQPADPAPTGHAGPAYSVCVVPGRPGQPPVLASAWSDGMVRRWDLAAGRPAGPPLAGHSGSVVGVCVVPGRPGEPPVLASAGVDGTLRLWDPVSGRAVGQPMIRSPEAVSGLAPGPDASTSCVTMHGDGTVRTWAPATATLHAMTSPPDVSAIATLDSGGNISLLTGDTHGYLHLSDPRTGHQPGPAVRVGHQAVLALCPLPGPPPATRVAAAGGAGTVTIITVAPGGRLEAGPILRGHTGAIRALCPIEYPPGRHLLAAAGNDATITIWDLAAPAAPMADPLIGHDGWIWSLAAIPARPGAPPGLASAGADHTIRRWDPVSGHSLGPPLTGHTDQVRALITVTSDDGLVVLASGGHDGTVRLWDPVTGTPGTVIPLGIPVHALLQQHPGPAARERTGGGATITTGLRTGILALDLHRDLFPAVKGTP